MTDFKAQGKKNKQIGADTERRVRKDLEDKGYIVDKFTNNVDLDKGELHPAKHKFRGMGIPMSIGTGFPDFIAYKLIGDSAEIIGVEVKSNGWIDQTEKLKCKWLMDNKVFHKILIASREKNGNRIELIYKEPRDVKDEIKQEVSI